ncbi:MAG: FMN-binding protein [Gemmatimonadales bacterium]|nr:FMN-binding protein [Gemmatimonadales bacterium]
MRASAPFGMTAVVALRVSVLLALLSLPAVAQSAPPARLAKSIERVYGDGAQVDTLRVDSARVYRISRSGTLLGFAQVRNVKGKDQQITYLVATDSADALRDIDILVYREPYGGEVAYEPWRKQFRGKTSNAALQVGKDIRNVSGATISSNAVTRGVRRALADLTAWRAAGKLR